MAADNNPLTGQLSNDSLDNKPKSGRGGPRPGSGRPKGKMEAATIERLKIKQAAIDRIHKNADKLITAQMNKAVGETYLMCKRKIGSGAKQRTETEIVTDPEIIKQYIDDELDDTDTEYYYMTTKPADNFALMGLLDRAFGKADSKVENTGEQKLIIEKRTYSE